MTPEERRRRSLEADADSASLEELEAAWEILERARKIGPHPATGAERYADYIGRNLERIERGGWTPVCIAEFLDSEEGKA